MFAICLYLSILNFAVLFNNIYSLYIQMKSTVSPDLYDGRRFVNLKVTGHFEMTCLLSIVFS